MWSSARLLTPSIASRSAPRLGRYQLAPVLPMSRPLPLLRWKRGFKLSLGESFGPGCHGIGVARAKPRQRRRSTRSSRPSRPVVRLRRELVLGWQSGAARGRGGGRAGRDPDLSLAIAAVRRRVAADRGVARARHRLAFAAGSAQQAVRVAGEVGEEVREASLKRIRSRSLGLGSLG